MSTNRSVMDVNDEEIIQGCINKDIEYMEILYEKYVSKLYNCALRYTKKVEDAEDVLQDAFICFWHCLSLLLRGFFLRGCRRIQCNSFPAYSR